MLDTEKKGYSSEVSWLHLELPAEKNFPRERVFATLPEISLSCSAVLLHSVERLMALKSRRDCYDHLV